MCQWIRLRNFKPQKYNRNAWGNAWLNMSYKWGGYTCKKTWKHCNNTIRQNMTTLRVSISLSDCLLNLHAWPKEYSNWEQLFLIILMGIETCTTWYNNWLNGELWGLNQGMLYHCDWEKVTKQEQWRYSTCISWNWLFHDWKCITHKVMMVELIP